MTGFVLCCRQLLSKNEPNKKRRRAWHYQSSTMASCCAIFLVIGARVGLLEPILVAPCENWPALAFPKKTQGGFVMKLCDSWYLFGFGRTHLVFSFMCPRGRRNSSVCHWEWDLHIWTTEVFFADFLWNPLGCLGLVDLFWLTCLHVWRWFVWRPWVRTNCVVKMQENSPGAGKCRSLRHDYKCANFKSGHEGVFFCRFFLGIPWAGIFFSFFFCFAWKKGLFVLFYMNLIGQNGTS